MNSIYIHIPFCVKKCNYCDFYSEEFLTTRETKNKIDLRENPKALTKFSDFLSREIELFSSNLSEDTRISSIFFGGGTPSLLSSKHLTQIINSLNKYFNISKSAEITLECNPRTTTFEKLKKYRQIGINRLSFGAQSFVQSELEFLHRLHNQESIEQFYHNAEQAGFDNINIDLMFSIPGQTIESLHYSIDKALSLRPEHISAYSLIYEPDTPLFDKLNKGLVNRISDEKDAEMYETVMKRFINAGFIQYEVSNFAINHSKKCKHNLNYWYGNEYIAFGPSSHGFTNNIRYWNYRHLGKYYSAITNGILPREGYEILSPKDKLIEKILLGLRAEGINIIQIEKENNHNIMSIAGDLIEEYIDLGYLTFADNIIKMTQSGYPLCDEIILNIAAKLE